MVERYAHVTDSELARAVRLTKQHADEAVTKTVTAASATDGTTNGKTPTKSLI